MSVRVPLACYPGMNQFVQDWLAGDERFLRRGAPESVTTIVAGQQVGFAGGPLYTLAKIASLLKLKRTLPDVKIIFLTMSEDPAVAAEAFRVGASGYLLKNSAASELSQAIREAVGGRSYVTPLATQGLVDSFLHDVEAPKASDELSLRQREVLRLLAEGHTMKTIARILKISPRTVAFHKYGMMKQLGVRSTAALVQYALKHGVAGVGA